MTFEGFDSGRFRLLRACPHLMPDLLSIVAYLVVMDAWGATGQLRGPLLAVLGFPVLFFVPGYAVVAALFPRRHDDPYSHAFAGVPDGALSTVERTLLAFGVSVALLPLIALAIEAVGAEFTAEAVLLGVSSVVVTGVVVAAVRRFQLHEAGELAGSRPGWILGRLTRPSFDSRADAVSGVLLVAVALVATASLGVALVAPGDGETYTSVALLTEDGTGNLTTAGYPTNVTSGERIPLVLQVENREDGRTRYTVVGQLQRVERTNGSTSVVEASELVRETRSVPDGGTWRADLSVTPTTTGEGLRLAFLVYRGDPPADPRIENAHESVHLWLDVTE